MYQPAGFRDPAVVEELRRLEPDVIAVVAYGRILPQTVLDLPPKGCVNIHASLLPALRGSGPIPWAVLQGLEETGVTAMFMAAEMDAGDMIAVRKTPIDPDENAQSLLNRLAGLGAELLSETLGRLARGSRGGDAPGSGPSDLRAHADQGHEPHRLDAKPPGDLESHSGPGSLACGHHGAGGKALSGLQRRASGQDHGPRAGDALGCDQNGIGDGLRRRRRFGDPGASGRRRQAHGGAGLFPGPSPAAVRRRYGSQTDGAGRVDCMPEAGAWSDGVLKEYVRRDQLDRREAALAARLCYGVLQNRMRLDFYLEQLVKGRLRDLQPVVLDILRLGLYQILWLEKVRTPPQ